MRHYDAARMWRSQLGDQTARMIAADWCDESGYPPWLGEQLRRPDPDALAVCYARLRGNRAYSRLPGKTRQLMRWVRDLLTALRDENGPDRIERSGP